MCTVLAFNLDVGKQRLYALDSDVIGNRVANALRLRGFTVIITRIIN